MTMAREQARVVALAVRPAKRGDLIERTSLQLEPTSGVVDDHGSRNRRQVTILAHSQWQAACCALDEPLHWTTRRANVLVAGIEFGPQILGKKLRIGEAEILVHGELVPCYRMDEQQDGLQQQLVPGWRGGIYGEVLHAGKIEIGQRLQLLEPC
jgi:MOSC domain-containing protein YiiM